GHGRRRGAATGPPFAFPWIGAKHLQKTRPAVCQESDRERGSTRGPTRSVTRDACHPCAHLPLEHVERHRSLPEDDVVKLAHVEAWTELACGGRAEVVNLELPHLVSQRLAGPDDVAI